MIPEEMYEKCICCGKTTSVLITEVVQKRKHYVSGAGQMCEKCFCTIYTNEQHRIVIDDVEVII